MVSRLGRRFETIVFTSEVSNVDLPLRSCLLNFVFACFKGGDALSIFLIDSCELAGFFDKTVRVRGIVCGLRTRASVPNVGLYDFGVYLVDAYRGNSGRAQDLCRDTYFTNVRLRGLFRQRLVDLTPWVGRLATGRALVATYL